MPVKNIFHLSDIHIRNGDITYSRYEEYKNVFENLFISLKNDIQTLQLEKKDYLIIITGDIFHNKNNIGNYGLMLYKILIENLTNIGLTIILEGNHDSIQHELNQPSLVTSTFGINNLIVLNETTSFVIDNIGFSYVNIRDTLDNFSNSGRKNILKPFPSINEIVDYKIALFHGTFASIKLYNGSTISSDSNPYPFEWIQDFDYALLGDIHLRQKGFYKKKLLWCYSGSLIQQNFGEDIIDHGYVIWDLNNNNIVEKNVLNNYGKIILKEIDNEYFFKKTNKFYNLDEYIQNNLTLFPKNIEIKFLTNFNYKNFTNYINKFNINYNVINNNINNYSNYLNNNTIITDYLDNNFSINNDNLTNYFKNHLNNTQYLLLCDIIKNNDYLLFNLNDYPLELHSECLKKNKELSTLINNCKLSQEISNKTINMLLVSLKWDNLFCYGNNNYIDFSNLSNSTFIISGKNGTGKSAIYDIITLSIWGEITKNKQNDISSGIINFNYNYAETSVIINVNNDLYKINRTFKKRKDNPLLIKINTILYKYEHGEYVIFKKDTACKEYINLLFGSLIDFLSSSMITQNIDYDILKMNYKECTELIDKATNIQYIYNLYNLLKTALNKYKDFNKIIHSKKEVYNSLVNNFNNDVNIDQCKSCLKELYTKKKETVSKLNSININDNISQDILDTNYDVLINKYNNIKIKSDDEYNIYFEDFNKLKYFFDTSNLDDDKILSLSLKYNNDIQISKNILTKPCELDFINAEENEIKNFYNFKNNYENLQITELNNLLTENNLLYSNLSDKKEFLMTNKPNTTNKPDFNYYTILNNILFIFDNNIENFIYFYNNNTKLNLNDSIENEDNITYQDILNNKKEIENINKNIILFTNKLDEINTKIKTLNQNTNAVNKPDIDIKFKTSKTVKKYLDKNNINKLVDENINYKELIDKYNNDLDYINNLENNLLLYTNELDLLNNNSEYKYDPNCIYCCKRPWVFKINELTNIINKSKTDINNLKQNLNKNYKNINNTIKKYEKNIKTIDNYNLYKDWYNYYIFTENKILLDNSIDKANDYKIIINQCNNNLNYLNNIYDNFLNLCYNLYLKYNQYNNYVEYNLWKNNYDDVNKNIIDIKNKIEDIEKHIYYLNYIKPKIDKIKELKHQYNKWDNYNNNLLIYNSYKYINIKKELNNYDLVNTYKENKELQTQFLYKKNLNNKLNLIENEIINYNNIISKFEIANDINNTNLSILNKLILFEDKINDIISIIIIIIDKFKDYKKWLYDNIILKNIVYNTNKFIKILCHKDTKEFELDYILTENKDIIHINWLIKNSENNQTISISQASGFQHFAISIALRLSLFGNKNCQQLFIDEGFTACDKNNLSIVPIFLKNLLKLFNTIIIVSHIDLIQDNIDEKIDIKYDNINKISSIQYKNTFI
jgi:DNA repair exonuclease SbcCD ATPase subunit